MGFWPSGQEKAIGFEDSTPKIPSSALHSDGHQAQKDQQCHNCAKDHACFRCISSLKLQKERTQNQNHQQSPVNEQVKKSGHSCRPRFAKSYKTKTETSKEMHHQRQQLLGGLEWMQKACAAKRPKQISRILENSRWGRSKLAQTSYQLLEGALATQPLRSKNKTPQIDSERGTGPIQCSRDAGVPLKSCKQLHG